MLGHFGMRFVMEWTIRCLSRLVKTKAKIAIREIDELEKTQEDIYSIPDM